jgi:hypothetical protein
LAEVKEGLIRQLFYEDNTFSLTRLIAFLGYLTFMIGSFYLLLNNIDWGGYPVFATYTGAVGAAVQTTNKYINSKYNSPVGSYGFDTNCCNTNEQSNTKKQDPNIGTK